MFLQALAPPNSNTALHCVIVLADAQGFMVQGGDPTGTGRGGTSIYGDRFADEISPELRFVGAGILAMANSGPNTNGASLRLLFELTL